MILKRLFLFAKNILGGRGSILGEVNNKVLLKPIYIKSKKFGKSTYNPVSLRIVINDKKSEPAGIGKLVNDTFFSNEKKFEFNVCFSCAAHSLFGKGKYADPLSIWFNVFIGYYEISAPKSLWKRAFGYKEDGNFDFEDLKKIGKADWNLFSAYMYGVPMKYISPYLEEDCDVSVVSKRVVIGDKYWSLLEVNNLTTVSPYESKEGIMQLEKNDELFTPLWQLSFGKPISREKFPISFFKVKMKMFLYISYSEENDDNFDELCYKTHMFGGSINLDYPQLNVGDKSVKELQDENEQFYNEQKQKVESTIVKYYKHLGSDT